MNLKLSKRLSAVADFVTKGNSVADVGTDHGYIPIYLVQNGISPYAVAMDIGAGPIERARANIRAFGVEDKVGARLCDGLAGIRAGETDSIVIAGMGGLLTIRILEDGIDKARAAKELILSPHSDVHAVRAFLARNAFAATDERIVKEDGKFYFVLRAERGQTALSPDPEPVPGRAALYYGAPLLRRRDATLKEYLERELTLRERILEKLAGGSAEAALRVGQIEEEIVIIREGLHYYESC